MQRFCYLCVNVLLLICLTEISMMHNTGIICGAVADDNLSERSKSVMADNLLGQLPEGVTLLTPTNFDAYVFPQRNRRLKNSAKGNKTSASAQQNNNVASSNSPWIIMFYAPWCTHCKTIIPRFFNASLLLETKLNYPHAKFGIVDAEEHKSLRERFNVTRYPTFIYTMGESAIINNNNNNKEESMEGKENSVHSGMLSYDDEYRAFLQHRWYVYQGGQSIQSFVQFAVFLMNAAERGSFTQDVSDIRVFSEWVAAGRRTDDGDSTAELFVYVPACSQKHSKESSLESSSTSSSSSLKEYQHARWNVILDNVASFGNVRLGVMFEDSLTDGWEIDASELYIRVVDVAQKCIREGKASGPDGELLISTSDRFRTPQCYNGPWIDTVKEHKEVAKINKKAAKLATAHHKKSTYIAEWFTYLTKSVNSVISKWVSAEIGDNTTQNSIEKENNEVIHANLAEFLEKVYPLRQQLQRAPFLHPKLEDFVISNSYRAVEELSAGMLSALEREGTHYIGILILNESVSIDNDVNYIPALREAIQQLNEAQLELTAPQPSDDANEQVKKDAHSALTNLPSITWTYINGQVQTEWLEKLKLQLSDLPSVIIFDVKRDRLFRLDAHMPKFDTIKQYTPWVVNGTQQEMISVFASNTITGVYRGEKSSFIGTVAEYLADIPVLRAIYSSLQYDDMLFVIIIISAVVFTVVMGLLLWYEPQITESERERAVAAARASIKMPDREHLKKTQENNFAK